MFNTIYNIYKLGKEKQETYFDDLIKGYAKKVEKQILDSAILRKLLPLMRATYAPT